MIRVVTLLALLFVLTMAGVFAYQFAMMRDRANDEAMKAVAARERAVLTRTVALATKAAADAAQRATDAEAATVDARKQALAAQVQASAAQRQANAAKQQAQASANAAATAQLRADAAKADAAAAKASQVSAIQTVAEIVRQWYLRVALISCDYMYSGTKTIYARGSGSGTVFTNGSAAYVLTNLHVLRDDEGYSPSVCRIGIPGDATWSEVYYGDKAFGYYTGVDAASVHLVRATNLQKAVAAQRFSSCSVKPSIGDPVVILGYPGIGAKGSVTATEGIIAGYESGVFVTSAKVEHGNSGGAAIDRTRNCFLGIPTYAVSGSVESLARIIDVKTIW